MAEKEKMRLERQKKIGVLEKQRGELVGKSRRGIVGTKVSSREKTNFTKRLREIDTMGKKGQDRRGRAWKEAGWREELKGVKRPWEREGKQERTMERGRRAVSPSQD